MYRLSRSVFLHPSKPISLNAATREIFILERELEVFLRGVDRKTKIEPALLDSLSAENKCELLERGILIESDSDEYADLRKKWVQNKEQGRYESLHIIPTTSCSLRCDYCFVLLQKGLNNKDISEEHLFKGIDFFFNGNLHPEPLVTFYGGEPLLKKEVVWASIEYIENTLKRKIRKRIITNGTELTEGAATKLFDYGFEIGVSIDGKRGGHDHFRHYSNGQGSHARVVENTTFLRENKIPWNVLCTVGVHNVGNLLEHVEFLVSLKPSAVALNMPRSLGFDDSLERGVAEEKYVAAYLSCLDYFYEVKVPELHFLKFLNDYFEGPSVFRPCSGCGSQVVLAPDGKVGPCQAHVVSTKYFVDRPGHISELAQCDQFRAWATVDNFASPTCRECELMAMCTDDCVMDRERRSGDMLLPSAFQCKLKLAMTNYFLERCYAQKNLAFGDNV